MAFNYLPCFDIMESVGTQVKQIRLDADRQYWVDMVHNRMGAGHLDDRIHPFTDDLVAELTDLVLEINIEAGVVPADDFHYDLDLAHLDYNPDDYWADYSFKYVLGLLDAPRSFGDW